MPLTPVYSKESLVERMAAPVTFPAIAMADIVSVTGVPKHVLLHQERRTSVHSRRSGNEYYSPGNCCSGRCVGAYNLATWQ